MLLISIYSFSQKSKGYLSSFESYNDKFFKSIHKTTIESPKPPTLDYVSINPETNEVIVNWVPSPDLDITGYGLQEEYIVGANSQSKLIYSIPGRDNTNARFIYPKVLSQPVYFNMDAYRVENGDTAIGLRTPSHKTMFTTLQFDTCNNSIIVRWTSYGGWRDKLKNYKIMQYFVGLDNRQIAEVDTSKNEYVVTNVSENQTYKFAVWAVRNDGKASISNLSSITTTAPLPPGYIVGDYTKYSGSDQLNLHYSIDPLTTKDSYRLYRSEASSDTYSLIAELSKTADGTINYSDTLPAMKVYNYKLQYVNKCNAEGMGAVPINNMLLRGKSEAMTNNLSWNSFNSWANDTKEVQVYRNSSMGNDELLATLSASSTEYADVISSSSQMLGDICYQVKAVSNPDQFGKTNISESNIFCVNMMGEVFVPNAFTPNNDGRNDIFKPSFAILPAKYSFIIYNRYGAKIYETNNLSDGWDGRLPDGTKALEGAYIYYIRLENGAGKVVEKRGNFTVIYP